MTDAATTKAPIEPVPPVPLETAPTPEPASPTPAAAPAPPAPDEPVAASSSAEAPVERAFPKIERAIGATRQAILDHFIDSEGDQSMSQIKAALPSVLPATVEACVRREWEAGRLLRISPGVYRLAPPKPPEAPKPPPPQPEEEAMWFEALERWVVDRSWDTEKLGPSPDRPNHRIPPDIVMRMNDRLRKRQERRREAEAAAAKRAAADAELRDRLIAATGGNIVRGPGIDDVSPIRAAMELVQIERILSSIRSKTDRKMCPGNEPATSWREPRLLKEIAENWSRTDIVPRLVDAWSKAGKAPSSPAAVAPMPDIDRSRHDAEHAPAGPHSLPAAADVQASAADASEAPAAVSAPPDPESASATPPAQPVADPDNGPAIGAEPGPDGAPPDVAATAPVVPAPQPDDGRPVAEGRQQVLAAFARSRAQASPQPAPPQPRPAVRQAGPVEPDMSDEGWEELIADFVAGNGLEYPPSWS